MFRKIIHKIKTGPIGLWHQKRLFTYLQKSGYFQLNEISFEKKEIHLGIYGFVYSFMEPKEKVRVQMLVHWYGWKPFQTINKSI